MDQIISFVTGGFIGGLLGTFFGGFTKFLWEKWLPDWVTWKRQQRIDREKVLSEIRGPAIRAVSELQGRIYVIVSRHAHQYKYLKELGQEQYYIESTCYLIARCCAWLEVLREKMAWLDYADLYGRLESITESFSHGTPGFQIFRLEQREIGERMLSTTTMGDMQCARYSDFVDLLRSPTPPSCFARLRDLVRFMLEHWETELLRLRAIHGALDDTITFLDLSARWIPRTRRGKLDVAKVIAELVERKRISKKEGDRLLQAANQNEDKVA